jgi:TRAP-type transport system periplasmic protein
MRIKGPLAVIATLVVPAGLLAQTATSAAPPRAEGTLKLRLAHQYDENYPWHKAFERFRDVLKARTGGAIDCQIFAGQALGTEKDYVSYLLAGRLDMAVVSPASIEAVAPEVSFFDLMYLFKDYDHWRRALDGKVGRHMADSIRKSTGKTSAGLEVLGYWSGSALNIVGRSRGYQTMDDLLGMKIRSQGVGVQMDQWKALGARPVMVPYEGVYAAFKDGLLDATPGVVPSVYSKKFHEVAPHISETSHTFIVRLCMMSGLTWSKLSPDQREHVVEAAREATSVARALEAQQETELHEILRTKHGVRFYPFRDKDLLREKTAPIRRRFAADNGLTELLDTLESEWKKR